MVTQQCNAECVYAGSKGGMPEGKDPELDSEVAKKKDPFFKEVNKRT